MANAIVTVHGGPSFIATVLGQSPPRIPTAGKIRAGIRVFARTASEQPRAREISEHGVAAGESFDRIERLLAEALPKLRNPLVPRNMAWFTVRSQKFGNPALVQRLMTPTARTEARDGTCTASRWCFRPIIGRR